MPKKINFNNTKRLIKKIHNKQREEMLRRDNEETSVGLVFLGLFVVFAIIMANTTPPQPPQYVDTRECLEGETVSRTYVVPAAMSPLGLPVGSMRTATVDEYVCTKYTEYVKTLNPEYTKWNEVYGTKEKK